MEVLKSWQPYLSECDPNTGTVAHYIVRNNMHEIAVSRLLMNIQNTIMSVALVPFPFRLSLLCAPWWLFHIYFLTSTTKLYKTSLHRHSLVALQQESSAVVHLNWTQTMLMRTVGSWLRIASTLAKQCCPKKSPENHTLEFSASAKSCQCSPRLIIMVEACIYPFATLAKSLSPKVLW